MGVSEKKNMKNKIHCNQQPKTNDTKNKKRKVIGFQAKILKELINRRAFNTKPHRKKKQIETEWPFHLIDKFNKTLKM